MILALALALCAPATASETGTWLLTQEVVSQTRDPHPLSKTGWRDVATRSTSVVEWREVEGQVLWSETTCTVETPPILGIRTEYTPAFVAAIPTPRRAVSWDGTQLKTEVRKTVLGASTDTLAEPTDPDADGSPGVTVNVSHPLMGRGEVYVAQASTSWLEGALLEPGTIRGQVHTAVEQRTLGASKWWLRRQAPVRPHPEPSRSWFELTQLPPGSACGEAS